MNIRRSFQIAVVVAAPTVLGLLLHSAAAWIVHNDSINYRIHDAGLGFLSNAAEEIFVLGPTVSGPAGLAAGLPTVLLCLRGAHRVHGFATLNFLAALLLLSASGSANGAVFAASTGLASILWIVAMVWAAIYPLTPEVR
jgi:hypothetical protein